MSGADKTSILQAIDFVSQFSVGSFKYSQKDAESFF
jgi:hypothetical protein